MTAVKSLKCEIHLRKCQSKRILKISFFYSNFVSFRIRVSGSHFSFLCNIFEQKGSYNYYRNNETAYS